MSAVITCGVLTVSDTCAAGTSEDRSGPVLCQLLASGELGIRGEIIAKDIVPDDVGQIQSVLVKWAAVEKLDLVVTTGGTGLSPRDVTPEAVRAVIDRDIFGMSYAMMAGSLDITPMAMVSRPVCGVKGNTIIITVPGSPKAAAECMKIVKPALPHALDLVKGVNKSGVSQLHSKMQGHRCPGHSHEESDAPVASDPSNVARRHRHSPFPMVSIETALDAVLKNSKVSPRAPDILDVRKSVGRVLATDVSSSCDIPPFDASIKDGYAVNAADGPGEYAVMDAITAGNSLKQDFTLQEGYCVRISTGAPLPQDANAVVQVEDTVLLEWDEESKEEKKIKILTNPTPGLDVRTKGSDLTKDTLIMRAGTKLSPADVGILASVGITRVSVVQKPKVAVLSTGNEVMDPFSHSSGDSGMDLPSGKIWDCNSTTLTSLVESKGLGDVVVCRTVPDDVVELEKALRDILSECDVIITSGSVSMGEKDLLKYVLQQKLGATVHFGRVNMKPGKPTTFATTSDGKLLFCLPGNPVSTFATAHLFVVPCLRRLCGEGLPNILWVGVELGEDFALDSRPEFHPAVIRRRGNRKLPLAFSTGDQRSSRLIRASGADVLLFLPAAENSVLRKGEIVEGLLL